MTVLASSLLGVLPKAHAFIGGRACVLPKTSITAAGRVFSTATAAATAATGTATAATTTFARRTPLALSHYWVGGVAVAVIHKPGLTGTPTALRMFASAGDSVMADPTTAAGGVKHVLVPMADGSEEIESVTIIDTLVRAGAAVTVASVASDIEVTCSRGVKIKADCKIADCEPRDWDAVVCPGGMPGAVNLKESGTLETILKRQDSEGRIIAAICAAPAVVLASHGLLEGRKATCYPAGTFTEKIPQLVDEKVVVDGNVVTSQGPATSMAFALQLVDSLFGPAKAEEIAKALLFK